MAHYAVLMNGWDLAKVGPTYRFSVELDFTVVSLWSNQSVAHWLTPMIHDSYKTQAELK